MWHAFKITREVAWEGRTPDETLGGILCTCMNSAMNLDRPAGSSVVAGGSEALSGGEGTEWEKSVGHQIRMLCKPPPPRQIHTFQINHTFQRTRPQRPVWRLKGSSSPSG